MREWLGDWLGVDGALWRSLAHLPTAPGRVTHSYLAGGDRYMKPWRLYLLASLMLFTLMKLADPGAAMGDAMIAGERDRASAEVARLSELLEAVRGGSRSGVTALALSLDAHAVAYLVGAAVVAAAWVSGWSGVVVLVALGLTVVWIVAWQALAIRRVHGAGPGRAVAASIVVTGGYGIVLLVALLIAWTIAFASG